MANYLLDVARRNHNKETTKRKSKEIIIGTRQFFWPTKNRFPRGFTFKIHNTAIDTAPGTIKTGDKSRFVIITMSRLPTTTTIIARVVFRSVYFSRRGRSLLLPCLLNSSTRGCMYAYNCAESWGSTMRNDVIYQDLCTIRNKYTRARTRTSVPTHVIICSWGNTTM